MPRTTRSTFYQCVDPTNPQAAGVCDRGGEVRPLRDLMKEMVYAGNRLKWNGFLCCSVHIDKPNPQDRVVLLPPDPPTLPNPRPYIPMVPLLPVLTDENGNAITEDGFSDIYAP